MISIKKISIIILITGFMFCVALTGCRPSPALTRMVEEDVSTDTTTAENARTTAIVDDSESEKSTETLGNIDNSTKTSAPTQPSNNENAKETDNDGVSSKNKSLN